MPKKPSTRFMTLYEKLDEYQQDAVEFALSAKTAGLFFEQGTGKTWITGGVIEHLWDDSFTGLLIVTLNNLESTWITFLREQLPQVVVYRDWLEYRSAAAPKLLILHYEAFPKIVKKARRARFRFAVYDESQKLKARATAASRAAKMISGSAEYKLILSGTPIEKQPQDLWAQFRFLVPGLLEDRWEDFKNRWLEPVSPKLKKRLAMQRRGSESWKRTLHLINMLEGKRPFDMTKLEAFLALIKPYALRFTKESLGLPPVTVYEEVVKLRGRQQRIYSELEDTLVASLGDGKVIMTPLRVTQLMRLHQVAGGYVSDDEGNVVTVGRAKLRRVLRIIKREDKPIVIFFRYLEELWGVYEELKSTGLRIATMAGSTKKKDRPLIIEAFQRGEIDVLLCQIKTGGVGIDLFRSHVAIFYSFSHSSIDFEQAKSRLDRRGQTSPVSIFLILAADTVDFDIHQSILGKHSVSSRVLENLKRRKTGNGEGKRGQAGGKASKARVQVWRERRGR